MTWRRSEFIRSQCIKQISGSFFEHFIKPHVLEWHGCPQQEHDNACKVYVAHDHYVELTKQLQFSQAWSRFSIGGWWVLKMSYWPEIDLKFLLKLAQILSKEKQVQLLSYQTTGNRIEPQHIKSTKINICVHVVCVISPSSLSSIIISATFARIWGYSIFIQFNSSKISSIMA